MNKKVLRFKKCIELFSDKGYEKIIRRHDKIYKMIKNSKLVDAEWYVKTYPEILDTDYDAIEHYIHVGCGKGCNPNSGFNTNKYIEEHDEVRLYNTNPLVHYIKDLKAKRTAKNKLKKFKLTKVSPFKRVVNSIWKTIGQIFYSKEIKENRKARIFVHLHLFYPMLWEDIKEYIKNLSPYKYTLCVTHPQEFDKKVVENIKSFKPDAELLALENKGYDIGPFMEIMSRINLDDYDIIYKLHSKRTNYGKVFMYSNLFKKADWYQYLYKGILGPFNVHKTIDVLMKNEKVGIVAAANLITLDPLHKQKFVEDYAKKLGIKYVENYKFVAGTCLAAKAKALENLKKRNITLDYFDMTKRGAFSFAHAMERVLSIDVMAAGYDIVGNPTCVVKKWLRKSKEKSSMDKSSLFLLKDPRFIIDYEFFYRTLENRLIKKAEIVEIRLSQLRRHWIDEKYYELDEVPAYKYLSGEKEAYENYIEIHKNYPQFPNMSFERFDNLIKSMDEKGYDDKHVIIVNKKNIILDGQHRSCYLLHKYGPDYMVKVLKLHF